MGLTYSECKERGICVRCQNTTKPLATTTHCEECREKAGNASSRLYKRRLAKHSCVSCGHKDVQSGVLCEACKERQAYYLECKAKGPWIPPHSELTNRQLVMNHYGAKCACCGETEPLFLEVDHINNDGAAHRKHFKGAIETWIVNHGFPDTFQILCANCNHGKHRNGGVCPHKTRGIEPVEKVLLVA